MSPAVFALLLYLAFGASLCLFLREASAGRAFFESACSRWRQLSTGSRFLFCLFFAAVAVYGSSKPTTTEQNTGSSIEDSSSSFEAASTQTRPSSASSPLQQASTDGSTSPSLPTRVWHDDPTDSDGDGIPDLWERWTYSDPLVPNPDVDRDNDGLSELMEYLLETDPRTADSDADGFPDGFEYENSMNPKLREVIVNNEPDSDGDGIPDQWEGFGYAYGFENIVLQEATENTFDVVLAISTTQSALLSWNGGSVIIPPCINRTCKIRVNAGEDGAITLTPIIKNNKSRTLPLTPVLASVSLSSGC